MGTIIVTAAVALTMVCGMDARGRRGGSFSKQSTAVGANGKTATRSTTGTRGDGAMSRSTVVTGPNGKTATTQVDATASDGTVQVDKTTTGPNGGTSKRSRLHKRNN